MIAQLRQDEFQARLEAAARPTRSVAGCPPRCGRANGPRNAAARIAGAGGRGAAGERPGGVRAASRGSSGPNADLALGVRARDRVPRGPRRAQGGRARLLEKGTIGREEDIDAQEAEVRGLEGRVVEADVQLKDTTLTRTLRRRHRAAVRRGRTERAGEGTGGALQDVDEIEIVVDVPETVMAADIRTADIVSDDGEFSGAPGRRVSRCGFARSPRSPTRRRRRSKSARPCKSPPDMNLLPGMTATVTVTYRRAGILGDQILVPVSAVFKHDRGSKWSG